MNKRFVPFEKQCGVRYYSDDERRMKGLRPEHMCIGEGVCPYCGQTKTVVSDSGVKGRDGYRGDNYFSNHHIIRKSHEEPLVLCYGSEQVFNLLIDEVIGAAAATA